MTPIPFQKINFDVFAKYDFNMNVKILWMYFNYQMTYNK